MNATKNGDLKWIKDNIPLRLEGLKQYGMQMIQTAIRHGQVEILKFLISKGIKMDHYENQIV